MHRSAGSSEEEKAMQNVPNFDPQHKTYTFELAFIVVPERSLQ